MNLISDRWIPIRRADGTKELIAPHEITRDIGDKSRRIVAVSSPRPDFDGALTQFLIGLLQTTCTPKTTDKWWDWREAPPEPKQLENIFKPYTSVFDLSGGNTGKLFMQERLAGSKKANAHPISYLLIGAPTDNALKTNTDHFQKRPISDEYMCPPCAAAALYTLQTFAPSGGGGGDGKFTSLRGGGPLTTVLLGDYLWETIWLNVLVQGIFRQQPYDEKTFPWLKIDKFISKASPVKTIHSKSMNPTHVFWGMPRRIELDFCTLDEGHACSVCGSKHIYMCRGYLDCSGGLTYQEGKGNKKKSSWINPRHPLSPYYLGEDERPSAVHPQPGGIGYRHWLGYVENVTEGKIQRLSAQTIEQFRTMVHADGRLWASGYDMDNMKARCWYDATMPVLIVDSSLAAVFKETVEKLIQAADWVSDMVKMRIKDALLGDAEVRGDLNFIVAHFWSATENEFYNGVRRIRNAFLKHQSELNFIEGWLSTLRKTALLIFDHYSQTGDFDAVNPRRVALARNDLEKTLNGNSLRKKLGLPNNNKITK